MQIESATARGRILYRARISAALREAAVRMAASPLEATDRPRHTRRFDAGAIHEPAAINVPHPATVRLPLARRADPPIASLLTEYHLRRQSTSIEDAPCASPALRIET